MNPIVKYKLLNIVIAIIAIELLGPANSSLLGQNIDEVFVERIHDGEKPFTYSVKDIVQDEQGFLWLATGRGLIRYDGRRLRIYDKIFENRGPSSASNLAIDKAGRIWVGTFLDGVSIYDPKTDRAFHLESEFKEIDFDDPIRSIWHIGDSTLITSGSYLYIIQLDRKHFYKIDFSNDIGKHNISIIAIDRNNKFWISKGTNGLIYYDPHLKTKEDLSHLVDFQEVNAGAIQNDSILVVGTSSGLCRINIDQRKERNISHTMIKGFSTLLSNYITEVYFDWEKNEIWEGRAGSGASLGNKFLFFKSDNENTLNNNYVHCIFKAKDGTAFIGTELGLNKIDPRKQYFKTLSLSTLPIRLNSQNKRLNQSVHVSTLYQDIKKYYWIGTIGDGLYKLDTTFNLIKHYESEPDGLYALKSGEPVIDKFNELLDIKDYLTNEFILSISEDKNGNIWIGSFNGITFLDIKRNVSKQYLKSDKSDNIHIVKCFGEYLVIFNDKGFDESKESNLYLAHINTPEKPIKYFKKGKFWVSGDQYNNLFLSDERGVNIFDPKKLEFELLVPKEHRPLFASEPLYNSQTGEVWLVSPGALHKYDISIRQTEGYLLPANQKYKALLMDPQNGIWIATNDGLLHFNALTNKLTRYNDNSGLGITYFEESSNLVNQNGKLFFGGFSGFVWFNSENISKEFSHQNLVITDIQLADKSITEFPFYYTLHNLNVEIQDSFTIPYMLNSIQIEFTDLNLADSRNYSYAYKLIPIDEQWRFTSEPVTALYTNLTKGNYTLLLRVIDPIHKLQVGEEKEISIVILPAPWQTWWAYILYFMMGSLILYIAVRQALVRSRLKSEAFHNKIEADKLHEIDKLKSRFFANISHEFRTPLTLLLAPLEKKLKQAQSQEEMAEFSLMHRSASRLLALVNQLLDLSRLEGGTLKLNLRHTDLKKFITSITSQFASMADSNGIQFIVNIEDNIELFIDHDKLEKVVTNLLSNAFKFTPAGGTITLSTKKGDAGGVFPEGYADITVTDTGPGIATQHLDKIFQRFYQVDDSSTRKFEGAGIGLALTRELVELHKGVIYVESELGKGSTFTVRLPFGFYHLNAEELTLEPSPLPEQPGYTDLEKEDTALQAAASEKSILIIEDNTDLRKYVKAELRSSFHILEAVDGEEGLNTAFEKMPTLIITDLMMPKRDGLQLCEILKNDTRTSHIPVILLTAKADIETKLQGLHIGADDYIAKPFVMEELRTRINNLIENRKRLREKYALHLALHPAEVKVQSMDERFLKNIMEVVEAHIPDSTFGVEQFAKETGMSQTQLYRKLHALTGFTPNEFVRHMRLERAADLFKQKSGNVADVAYQVGFNNLSYFAKCFREKFGESPSQFLSRQQG